jgi:metallophosphoesterase superfamily enzyme
MTKEFYTELAELIQKHKLTLITGNGDNLVEHTKGLQGNFMFVTNGEKKIDIQGGESMVPESPTTILIHKNRYKG